MYICVDDTIWTGDPGNYTNPDAPKVLSEVRKLVNDGKYAEVTKAAVNLSGNPSQVPPIIVQKIFTQIFSYINVQLFNRYKNELVKEDKLNLNALAEKQWHKLARTVISAAVVLISSSIILQLIMLYISNMLTYGSQKFFLPSILRKVNLM